MKKTLLTVWEMPTETSEGFPSELFQLQSEGDSTAFAFDELQIILASNCNELIRIPIPMGYLISSTGTSSTSTTS